MAHVTTSRPSWLAYESIRERARLSATAAKPFLTGAAAGCFATAIIQPMDMVKVRIQLGASAGTVQSPFTIAKRMVAEEGFVAFYNGLSAGLLRQVIYTGARIGFYDQLCTMCRQGDESKPLPLATSAACAIAAGGTAAVLGSPADLSLVRMQADSMLPVAERRGYTSVISAFASIVRLEGLPGLFKGAGPTATRAMGLNLGMLAGNTEAKKHLSQAGLEGDSLVFCASAVAGFFASAFSLPFDFVKTCIQKQQPDARGVLPYKSSIDCVMKNLREGGPLRFYAGFPTFYLRIAPHAMITLLAADKVKQVWKAMGL